MLLVVEFQIMGWRWHRSRLQSQFPDGRSGVGSADFVLLIFALAGVRIHFSRLCLLLCVTDSTRRLPSFTCWVPLSNQLVFFFILDQNAGFLSNISSLEISFSSFKLIQFNF